MIFNDLSDLISSKQIKDYLWNYLDKFKKDNRHLWELNNYGKYNQIKSTKKLFNIQKEMIELHSKALTHFEK